MAEYIILNIYGKANIVIVNLCIKVDSK